MNLAFEGQMVGNPHLRVFDTLESVTLKNKQNLIGIEKHIRIADAELNNQINKILELPQYKSFNQVVNDALFYGLPILCEKLFGETKLQEEQSPPSVRGVAGGLDEKSFNVIVKLLKETVLNVTINKSILSSVFHNLKGVNKALNVDTEQYEQGLMSDTPDYLYEYETQGIKKMRR